MTLLLRFLIICGVWGLSAATILDVEGYGRIRGSPAISFFEKRPYHAFYRLHYAKPPTGEARFLPPEPIGMLEQNETDVWDATIYGPQCPQGSLLYSVKFDPSAPTVDTTDEDCLLLNVFTPKLPKEDSHPNLPVLFFIHGGSFSSGGTHIYTPFKFMDEDVVLVVIQYRLGPLGFLSFQTDELPGNAGMFDQVEALRWVKNHIYDFGGDSDRITIFGESAGGASVSLLMLSPHAEGLFQGVIGESGSAIAEWAVDRDPVPHGQAVADKAGCFFPDNYPETVDCLRNVSADVLMNAFSAYSNEDMLNGGLGFGGSAPVIQTAGKLKFIDKDPVETLNNGDYNTTIPAIFGANRDEGSFVLGLTYVAFLEPNGLLNDSYFLQNDMVPTLLGALGVKDPTTALSDTLMEKYLMGEDTTNFTSMIPGLTDMLGVFFLKAAGYRNTELHALHNPKSYWYSFDFQGRYSDFIYLFIGNIPPIPHGVTHSDELQYLFTFPTVFNHTENEVSKRMLRIWANFATYGEPTPDGVDCLGVPKWEPFTSSQSAYMSMNTDFTLRDNYEDSYTVSAEGSRAGMDGTTIEPETSSSEHRSTPTPTTKPTSTIPTTPNPDDYVDIATYNALLQQKDDLVVGTSIASVAAILLCLALIGLVVRSRQLGNKIV